MTIDKNKIGKALKILRKQEGYNMRELTSNSGYSVSHISNLENGYVALEKYSTHKLNKLFSKIEKGIDVEKGSICNLIDTLDNQKTQISSLAIAKTANITYTEFRSVLERLSPEMYKACNIITPMAIPELMYKIAAECFLNNTHSGKDVEALRHQMLHLREKGVFDFTD